MTEMLSTEDFDFDLPEELIAQTPLEKRDSSRLLVLDRESGQIEDKHFDEIIEFAELQDFVDVPLKNFSSGMAARLGFAVATIVKPEILIVDEVLAVGDAAFQEKCKQRMEKMLAGGTTLLFVSHSIDQVKELCQNVIWIDKGVVKAVGKAEDVIPLYE